MAKKIFIIYLDLGIGGIQRKIIDVVNYLVHKKKDLKIYILLRRNTDFNIFGEIKNKNVRIIFYDSWLRKRIPFFFPIFVIYHVGKLKPQSILAFLDFCSGSAILAKLIFFWRKIKVILSEDHFSSGVVPSFRFGRLRTLIIRFLYPFADVIFTCTKANKNDLVKNYRLSSTKIKLITNWTMLINQKFKKQISKYDLIYVGRLEKVKNVIFLLKGLKRIKRVRKDISLCLLGEGKDESRLKKYVKKNSLEKNVIFAGSQRDIEKFLAKSKVFVFSPKKNSEGFPLVILEAMAYKIPVLSYEFAGIKEVIKDNENGFIFKSMDEFIKKVFWLLKPSSKKTNVINRALKYVKKNHSPKNIEIYLNSLGIL